MRDSVLHAVFQGSRVLFKAGFVLVQFVWILFTAELILRSCFAGEVLEPYDIAEAVIGLALTAFLSIAGLSIRGGLFAACCFGACGAAACFAYVWLFLDEARLSAQYVWSQIALLW